MNSELLIHNAAEKLQREMKSENPSDPATMIQKKVAEVLNEFCKQDKQLAEAILNSKKGFAECCKSILNDTKQSRCISDFDAYSRAVKFYLPDAEIEFQMKIVTPGAHKILSFSDLLEV